MNDSPRISFGIIVLNGEPFVRYNLRALYPFAHEIIVVEGASPNAAHSATPDGHSVDGTLETLYRFKAEEDPEDKIQIITRNDFWLEKDEQSFAYAERATGDYLWQVDIDEFYQPEDMEYIVGLLQDNPSITGITFEAIHFWGGFDYFVESGVMWYPNRNSYRRVFKFGPDYRYVTHRPPMVLDPTGRDVMTLNALSKEDMAARGIYIYHYYAVFPDQVTRKANYYVQIGWEITNRMDKWATDTWMKLKYPFHVFHAYHNYYSWLKRFTGPHPPLINTLRNDIDSGLVDIKMRQTDDIERLLNSVFYKILRACVQVLEKAKIRPIRIYQFLRQRMVGK